MPLFGFLMNSANKVIFDMDLCRSKRIPKPRTIWEAKGAPCAASDPKVTKKTARTEQQTALKPIVAGPLPEALEINENQFPELPEYELSLILQFQRSKSLAAGLSQLDTFQRLLTPVIIDRIVESTNSYAENIRNTNFDEEEDSEFFVRPWKPVNVIDIWRYIGCLLYMGYHRLSKHKEHWSESGYLDEFINLVRYEQIHRYFTFRDRTTVPRKNQETFTWQVESIGVMVKQNCKKNWQPSSHLVVDETMIAYRGHSFHKVKLPNKSIKEGYKVWILDDVGYVYDWLWHSRIEGPEAIP